jgi:methylamine dehydrogenase accessory protein MauD
MTGFWLLSYLCLWALVIIMVLLQLGILRQLGLSAGTREAPQPSGVPTYEDDGPTVGDEMPDLVVNTVNGHGEIDLRASNGRRDTLVMFLSPLCEACYELVEPLNALADNREVDLSTLVVLSGSESACRSFMSVFPLLLPVTIDKDSAIWDAFQVHHRPYGLLYNAERRLVRKGSAVNVGGLAALLGEAMAPKEALAHVFPRRLMLHSSKRVHKTARQVGILRDRDSGVTDGGPTSAGTVRALHSSRIRFAAA